MHTVMPIPAPQPTIKEAITQMNEAITAFNFYANKGTSPQELQHYRKLAMDRCNHLCELLYDNHRMKAEYITKAFIKAFNFFQTHIDHL